MAEYDLGTAKGKIEVDGSGVKAGVNEAERALDGLDSSAKKSSESLRLLSAGAAAIGVATVAGFGLAINVAADFEAQLSGIKAVSGATEKQMDSLRKKALQLGADTSFSASESAAAMEELIKAGLTVDDVLNGAADATVNLAAAGGVALPEAATIAANAMNQFGLSAEQMPHVADLIAGAANASAIDVSDFGLSLAQAGAVANLTGLKFDDLALAITAMGNAGIKGSDAGTSLKTFLTGLQPTTEKQIDLFYDLGLAIEDQGTAMNEMGNQFFTAEGQVKSMSEIAGTLATALAGMSEQQKIATLETLFGSDAIRAAAIIADTGAEGFDNLAASMGGITAADVAASRLDNFNGSMEQLKGSLETLLINIGTPFLGFLRDMVDRLTDGVNWFNQLSPQTQTWAAAVIGATGAVIGLLGAYGLVLPYIRLFAGAVQLATVALAKNTLALVTNPWFLLLAAIVAIVAAIIYAYKNFEGFREVVDDVIARIKVLGEAVWEWIQNTALPALRAFGEYFMKNLWPQIKAFVGQALEVLREFAQFFVDEIVPRIRAFVDRAIEIITGIIDFIVDDAVPAIVGAWQAMVDVLMAAWNWFNENVLSTIIAAVQLIIAVLDPIIGYVTNVFIPALVSAWNVLWPIVQFVFDLIVNIITTAMSVISSVIGFAIDAIMTIWNLFGDNIIAAVVLAFNYIKGTIETVLGIIRGIFQVFTGLFTGDWDLFLTGLRTIWDAIWNGIKTILETILGAITLIIQTAIDLIKATIQIGLDAIKLVWDVTWTAIKQIVETAINFIKLTIETTINAIKAVIETTLNAIKFVWETIWGGISSFVSGIWEDIKGIVKAAIDSVWSTIQSVGETIRAVWDNIWETIKSTLKNIWDTMVDTVEDRIDDVLQFFKDLPGNIADALSALADKVVEIGKKIVQWVVDGIKAAPGAIKDAIMSLVPSAGDIISGIGGAIGGGISSLNPFASGGIVVGPTAALIGEAGPEAVVPMTDPDRALTVMAAAGLDRLLLDSLAGGRSTTTTTNINSGVGEVIHIDEYIVQDPSDADALLTQAEFAYQGGRFG